MGRFVYEIDIASWYVKPLKWTTVDGYEISEKISLSFSWRSERALAKFDNLFLTIILLQAA